MGELTTEPPALKKAWESFAGSRPWDSKELTAPPISWRATRTIRPISWRRRFDQLLADTREEQFQLRLAAEYMLDNQFNEQLRRYTPLTYDGIHLLVELPQYYLPGAWKGHDQLRSGHGIRPCPGAP